MSIQPLSLVRYLLIFSPLMLFSACTDQGSEDSDQSSVYSVAENAGITETSEPLENQVSLSEEGMVMVEKLQNLQLDQLGNPQIKSDAVPPVQSTAENPHRMLIIPVQYSNRSFDRFAEEVDSEQKNREYLQELLFSEDLVSPREETLTHYFYHQSQGDYIVTGEIFPIVTMEQPSEYYGSPVQNSDGSWRNDAGAELLVEDALYAAYALQPDFNWDDYDIWDPLDYDDDGLLSEPDGYIDHFVLVFAGKGQSSCQGLYNLNQKFTYDAPADLYDSLAPQEQECAQRIWPHRFSLTKNNGKGPQIDGIDNRRGGVELREGLWAYDYNMQSEYTGVSTFIHEFGHSIGLPDIYARQTNNSTAAWDIMSSTASPVPQEMSTWSRLMLGWMDPCIITPNEAGGAAQTSVYLKTMNDWSPTGEEGLDEALCDAAMVILPPKIRELRMGPLTEAQGQQSAYTGQGNDLNHYLSRTLDFRQVEQDIFLDLDAWFRIEADWDYLYVTVSIDGEDYRRLMPIDKSDTGDTESVMPSQRGHDGAGTIPGFTGRSGDMDGDGRVETSVGCNPDEARELAEDRVGTNQVNPCEISQWVEARFDLSDYAGQEIELRFHYFADMAAVEDGALIDNVAIDAIGFYDDFETDSFAGWNATGFSLSGGSHDIAVPHFYLVEYRDPYEEFDAAYNYDNSLDSVGLNFMRNEDNGNMEALDFQYRSGVLVWYYNGEYLWSQNEPAQFGPGNGFLLLVDSNPQEYDLAGIPDEYLQDDEGWRFYEFDESAQSMLQEKFLDVMCFERKPEYYPLGLSEEELSRCDQSAEPAAESILYEGRPLLYGYNLVNEYLPGEARDSFKSAGTVYDYRLDRDGSISYRLYDRMLRSNHSADAPFAVTEFASGIQYFGIEDNAIVPIRTESFAATSRFSDADPSLYLNPHLPFGSANIPMEGLDFELFAPDDLAPEGTKVRVDFSWSD